MVVINVQCSSYHYLATIDARCGSYHCLDSDFSQARPALDVVELLR